MHLIVKYVFLQLILLLYVIAKGIILSPIVSGTQFLSLLKQTLSILNYIRIHFIILIIPFFYSSLMQIIYPLPQKPSFLFKQKNRFSKSSFESYLYFTHHQYKQFILFRNSDFAFHIQVNAEFQNFAYFYQLQIFASQNQSIDSDKKYLIINQRSKKVQKAQQNNQHFMIQLSFEFIFPVLVSNRIFCYLLQTSLRFPFHLPYFLAIKYQPFIENTSNRNKQKMDTKYKMIDLIGEGSFGSVYLVKDSKDRSYALKKIHVDPFEIQQALKQIQIMKKFVHPNLIKIYQSQFNQSNELLQIAMEYCSEGDLFNYYKKKKNISVEQILRIFKQIVQAFIVMNVKGVIHRDLKPQNILIGKGSVIKIADFGCARSVNKQHISQADNFSLDKGTPIYASPQQLMNQKYSAKCDVWSAGCLLYFIYFGQHPFMDKKVHNTLSLIKKRTESKEIELEKKTDLTIAQILQLTLIYEDKERASWRQLSLSRIFSQKITSIQAFVEYLKHVSIIANWIAKEFWKWRKGVIMQKHKDEIFVYFIIKFQVTSMKMALEILEKDQRHSYLFNLDTYKVFKPQPQLIEDIKRTYSDHQKYYTAIKKSMKTKDVYKLISERQPSRVNCFSDLDNSIRACYKILLDIKKQLKDGEDNKIWGCMSKWINFERNFSFEHEPRVQKILAGQYENIQKIVNIDIDHYEQGIID